MKELNWKTWNPLNVHLGVNRSAWWSGEKWVTFTLWLKPSGSLHLIVIWLKNIDNRRLRLPAKRRWILSVTLPSRVTHLVWFQAAPSISLMLHMEHLHAHTNTHAWKSTTFRGSATWNFHIKKREEWGAALMCSLVLVRVIFFTWKLAASNKNLIQLLQGRRRLECSPAPPPHHQKPRLAYGNVAARCT